jgi:NAD(P)-dependent dehydrogenase (short-subunit alcohol dehydrogenase family)
MPAAPFLSAVVSKMDGAMSILSIVSRNGPTGFGYSSTAEDVTSGVSLAGKTILVTGCNSGLGLEAMRVLALRGAHVIGTLRTQDKAAAAGRSIGGATTGLECELSDPKSVRACIAAIQQQGFRLDAIIANAGIMALPKLETGFGYELQFFTNHIGHFMLVTGLLDSLKPDGRVVMLSSALHKSAPVGGIDFDNLDGKKGYKPWTFYGQSKMANLLFAKELARRFQPGGQTAYAVHPGVILTNLSRNMGSAAQMIYNAVGPLFTKTIPQGAATEVFCAANPKAAKFSGEYLADCNVAKPRADANNPVTAQILWDLSESIVAKLPR